MAWLAGVQLNSVFLFSPSQAMSESRVFERIQTVHGTMGTFSVFWPSIVRFVWEKILHIGGFE